MLLVTLLDRRNTYLKATASRTSMGTHLARVSNVPKLLTRLNAASPSTSRTSHPLLLTISTTVRSLSSRAIHDVRHDPIPQCQAHVITVSIRRSCSYRSAFSQKPNASGAKSLL